VIGEKYRWPAILLLTLCLLGGLIREVNAGEETPLLVIDSIAGQFTQAIRDGHGNALAHSEGAFALLKPHFFRWEITAPGRQVIVSDGQYVWQHDQDLETVNQSALADMEASPLAMLLEDEETLSVAYEIDRTPDSLTLRPRNPQRFFDALTFRFADGVVTGLTIVDTVGQIIDIELALDPQTALTRDDFTFELPEGVDFSGIES